MGQAVPVQREWSWPAQGALDFWVSFGVSLVVYEANKLMSWFPEYVLRSFEISLLLYLFEYCCRR